jgi:predicted secreted Zn-dependent protease
MMMKKVVLSIYCLMASSQANADVKLDFPFQKKFEVYEISGNSVEEIERSFNARPEFLVNEGFDGYTAWKYDFHTDDDSCEIHEFELEVTYTLPKFEMSKTSDESAEEFRPYLEKLYRHEQIHCALAVKSLHEMYLAFKRGQRGECSSANDRVIELEGDLVESNALFDVYTSHGEIELAESPFGERPYLKVCEIPFAPMSPRI